MTLVMTILARDEGDILRENLLFHLDAGVDHVIVTDNLSVDETPDIIDEFARQGVVTPLRETGDDFRQGEWVTRMARMAAARFRADWVINSDADEFWIPRAGGSLAQALGALPFWRSTAQGWHADFVCIEDPALPFHERMLWRKRVTTIPHDIPAPPKYAHRGARRITVVDGAHAVHGGRPGRVAENVLDILHFTLRSRERYMRKIRRGGEAFLRNPDLPETVGFTWRRQYRELLETNSLRFVEENLYDPAGAEAAAEAGTLVRDLRVRDRLRRLLAR
ncbi:glycosyltransferase family 2 protein [Albimonas pacifica]|uniref:Glycosyl transferase family 2 n=1 Tax=Albimonas pacifica TaxID=1114924 RepID=A0A1I3D6F3_9RHOB|nr:glycosyltransferase family 2 protein [Albimonas pacifica]SFH82266.1 Glycosyl transferase family 2 [Albimonas pacifica]